MAKILDFPEMQTAPSLRRARRAGHSAEIVIFPGVRYERRTDEPKTYEEPRIERDRLQLIE